MKRVGIWFIILSIGSVILQFFGMDFILVSWVDYWGVVIGVIIRAVILAVGIGLVVAGRGE